MTLLFLLVWFVLGLIGAYLLFLDWQLIFKEPLCPTPIQIIQMCLTAWMGLCILVAGVLVMIIRYFNHCKNKDRNWWNTPICKKKDK
jgi:hypothetical protein